MVILPIIVLVFFTSVSAQPLSQEDNGRQAFAGIDEVSAGFRQVPDSIRAAVYWYWLNNNISKEGVVKDLQAMKRVGITRAFIGNQQTDGLPYGQVRLFSDEWWDITRTAMKTASELDIELGMFNCPGWSQSGGPWIKPEQSMKYAELHEQHVSGNGKLQTLRLPAINSNRIISVLAYPTPMGTSQTWTVTPQPHITLQPDKSFTARTLSITSDRPYSGGVTLSHNGRTLASFHFDRHNTALNVGFKPLAPWTVTLPETQGQTYDLQFDNTSDAQLTVTLSEVPTVEQYADKSLAKVFQDPLPAWDYYMWKTPAEASDKRLYINPTTIVDLTDKIIDGTILWTVPAGQWTVLTAYMETTGVTNSPAVEEGTGLEVDKMNRGYIRHHFDAFIGDLIRRIPAEERKTWRIVVEDSYETGSQNWTDDMAATFRDTYGYDPIPFLPTLKGTVVGSTDMSDRFLWDLRRLVADRVAYDYVGGLRDECHRHGMTSWLENYGHWGFPGEFLMYGGQSDEVSGEFWSEGSLGDIENRAASSCAHIYGKQKVWAESCTAGGPQFSRYPYLMKQRVDRFFCEGINASLLHLYIQQPDDRQPGLDAWFGNEFNRNNCWFDGFGTFVDYLRRCNFILQQGRYVADIAYFIGEDTPKMTGICDPAPPQGYSFDYINAEVLLKHSRVSNHRLVLDSGMEYAVLVLPRQDTMRPEVLRRISELVGQGLTIVGPAPQRSPSLQDYPKADTIVRQLAQQLWTANGQYGAGHVYPDGTSLKDILTAMGIVPDFHTPEGKPLAFIHRALPDGDIYFVANQSEEPVTDTVTFRIPDSMQAELWNPVTGERRGIVSTATGGRQKVAIALDRLESTFIVFKAHALPARTVRGTKTVTTDHPWDITFAASAGKPAFVRTGVAELTDWSSSDDPDIRSFSGSATYVNTFRIDSKKDLKNARIELNLGKVMVLGSVKINGQAAGGVWTYPYRLDITDYVRKGQNRIEVTVYNNWRNRLIADEHLPADERKTWTNIQPWQKDAELQSSGLLGPVSIQISYLQ